MKMKKLALALIGLALCGSAFAQDTNSNNPIVEIGKGIAALGSSTNWGFVPYGTIGKKKADGQQAYGAGILGIYNLDKFIGLGGGIDELTGLTNKSMATIISANVQLQMPLKPLSGFFTNSAFAQGFTITPFLYSGLGTPLGNGINQSAVSHEGEGINIDIIKVGTWQIGAGYAYIERQNAGAYSGNYQNVFISLHHPF